MDIPKVPGEVVVAIAEQMEVATLRNFMAANKSYRLLINTYRQSICKTKLGSFPLRPAGNALSSAGVKRQVCEPGTFPFIEELELRDIRVAKILNSGYVDLSSPPGLDPLNPVQQRRFAAILERALWRCDAVADVAANVKDGRVPEHNYTLISSGYWNLAGSLPDELRQHDPFTNINARGAQIKYLNSLSLEDLAGLYLLIISISVGLIRDRPAIQGDPNFAERITVFEECTLRHGTWFLWPQVSNDTKNAKARSTDVTLREMTGHMLLAGFAELIGWETGVEDLPPGLRMSLLDAARKHFEDKETSAVLQIWQVIRKLILGADEADGGNDDDDDDEDDDDGRGDDVDQAV
ncbi:hypothetical protein TruAng_008962 [Truncatella angustata]|nr:hypothetical protein TruAng_008962 [Truncatella angustata]